MTFAYELAAYPDLVDRLLEDHIANEQGFCRMHSADPQCHPCAIRQLALLTRSGPPEQGSGATSGHTVNVARRHTTVTGPAGRAQSSGIKGPVGVTTAESERVAELLRIALSGERNADAEGTATSGDRVGLWVAYQVMVDLDTRRLVGVEALARLVDEQDQPVAPEVFIPIAEGTGLIASLGRRVLDIACTDLADWHARYPDRADFGVSVNVSAYQAELVDLVSDVRQSLHEAGLSADSLTLELTESAELTVTHPAVAALKELRRLGVHITIDDLGTGYASLSQLTLLPMTGMKVDRRFTAGLPHDLVTVAIVAAITTLARDLGLTCVVEGIETDAQLAALPAGVIGQGYLLGRPVTAAQIGAHLAVTPITGG